MSLKKKDQDEMRRWSNALDRQLKGVQTNTKLASDATYGENYREILSWLANAETCLQEAKTIAVELRDAK
jgi:Iap family predicted aminopeptidase